MQLLDSTIKIRLHFWALGLFSFSCAKFNFIFKMVLLSVSVTNMAIMRVPKKKKKEEERKKEKKMMLFSWHVEGSF